MRRCRYRLARWRFERALRRGTLAQRRLRADELARARAAITPVEFRARTRALLVELAGSDEGRAIAAVVEYGRDRAREISSRGGG